MVPDLDGLIVRLTQDVLTRSSFTKHFEQIACYDVWLLPGCEVSASIINAFVHYMTFFLSASYSYS